MAIEGIGYRPIPDGFIPTLNDDTSSLLIVFYATREGSAEWTRYLEHTFYPPGTTLNNQIDILMHYWDDWPFIIVRIPLVDRAKAEAACEKTGMRLADGTPWLVENSAGVQICINVRKPPKDITIIRSFPLQSRRTFTLEKANAGGKPFISGAVILPAKGVRL